MKRIWDAPVIDLDNGRDVTKVLVALLIWLGGLLSTIYLVVQGSILLFFTIGFINHASPDFTWGKVAAVGQDSMLLFIFAAIGFAGLRFWPHRRFRLWGLCAIIFQTAMAIGVYANPVALLRITDFSWATF